MQKTHLLYKVTFIYILLIIFFRFTSSFPFLSKKNRSENNLDNQTIIITGRVDNIPEYSSGKMRLILKDEIKKDKILINIYNPEKEFFYGDILKIEGKIRLPHKQRNPGGIDEKKFLEIENIKKIINTTGKKSIKIGFDPENKIKFYLFFIRKKIVLAIKEYLPLDYASIFSGIFLGAKEYLPQKILELFQKGGIIHILSVSGLHVGILSFIIYLLTSSLSLSMRNKAIINITMLFCYAIITGASPPVLRSVFMVSIILIAWMFNHNTEIINSLCLALLITLIFSPNQLFSTGLILSYVITWSIIIFVPIFDNYFKKLPDYLRPLLTTSLAAALASIPLSIYFFYTFSPISLLLNILIIPIVSIIMSAGVIFTFSIFILPILAKITAEILIFFITLLIKTNSIAVSLPGAYFYVPVIPLLLLTSYFVFLFAISNPSSLIKKIGIFQILSVLIFIIWKEIITFNGWLLKINYIDVGQGDAIFLNLPGNKNLLIDGGPNTRELVQYLHENGKWGIDVLVITHADKDHVEGLYNVINQFPIGKIYFNLTDSEKITKDEKNFVQWLTSNSPKLYSVYQGDSIEVSPFVQIKVINPAQNLNYSNYNDNSIVLQLKYKKFSAIFTGDIGISAENQILSFDSNLTSTVLKIAHHGSKYSTSEKFLETIHPDIAVISAGKNNKFGHPHPSILEKLSKIKSKIFRTDKNGMISIVTDGIKYNTFNFLNTF